MRAWKVLLRTRKREYAVVLLFFFVLALLFTWPLILHLHDGILGGHGDPLLNTWIISWDARTLFTSPSHLFQPNILYPSLDALTYSEHLLTLGVMAAPIYYSTGNPLLAYNILLLFGLIFSGFGCYLLVKELTASRWGGIVAGVAFAFCPYKMSKLSHLHILFSPFLPLMLLYLYRFLDHRRKKHLLLFGLFFLVQSLVGWHYLIICVTAAGVLWLWNAAFARRREQWAALGWVIIALVIAGIVLLPVALPYLRTANRLPDFRRTTAEAATYSSSPDDFFRVLPQNLIYGKVLSFLPQGKIGSEFVLFPGLVVLALALAGLFIRRGEGDDWPAFEPDSYRKGALYFLALTLLGIILTLGPEPGGISNPLYTIPFKLGLISFIRVPTRFYLLACLGFAGLAGFGTAKISIKVSCRWGDIGWGRTAAVSLVVLLLLELLTFNLKVYPLPIKDEVPEVYAWLADQGNVRVIELPVIPLAENDTAYDWDMWFPSRDINEHIEVESMRVYFSATHWKTMANGYSGYMSYFYRRTFTEMQAFPSERSLDLLAGLGIDYVIWDWDLVDDRERAVYDRLLSTAPGLGHVGDFGSHSVFRVEPRSLATAEDLEVSALVPRVVPRGEGFNLSLNAYNLSRKPYVAAVEEPQNLALRFIGQGGETAHEEDLTYRAPFFLEPGEGVSLPLQAGNTPASGDYKIQLHLEGGVLGQKDLLLDIQVVEARDIADTWVLDGSLNVEGRVDTLEITAPGGLQPLTVDIVNSGDNFWGASWEEESPDAESPFGLVAIWFFWEQEGQRTWDNYSLRLPCDMSQGQSIRYPLLVRPPPYPGEYRLVMALHDIDLGTFGPAFFLDVVVKEPASGD